jgi:phosphoribosyl-ATP pyrophosphohydrolase/phosphoribosyl-AMP cyclohydrolase
MQISFDSRGLIPAIVQDQASKEILMMAWMNSAALHETQVRGEAVFWSRSRQELWHKGATSGNRLIVEQLALDCDGDALLLSVTPLGPACHTGQRSCFHRVLEGSDD